MNTACDIVWFASNLTEVYQERAKSCLVSIASGYAGAASCWDHFLQKQLLQNFKPDYRVKFLTDYRRWRTIFDEIRAITEAPTSDADLQQFIETHYLRDNRQHIVTAIHHARNEDWDFATTLQKKYVMLMIELQYKLLANQSMLCRRTLLRITQRIQISTARNRLSHAILIRKVNVSEETTVDILMTLQLTMIMTNDLTSLKPTT